MNRAIIEEVTLDSIDKDSISKHDTDLNLLDKPELLNPRDSDALEAVKQRSMESIAFNDYKDEI